jgi:hypothetical protein
MKQIETKLNTYRDLRAFDPQLLLKAFSRKDIKASGTLRVSDEW